MNDSCENQPNGCTDAALNAAARGDTLATTSTVTMVGALTAAAAGVVLLLLNPSAKPRAVSVTSAGFAARF